MFTDDPVLLGDSEEKLKRLVQKFGSVCQRRKLSVNETKSKIMKIGNNLEENVVNSSLKDIKWQWNWHRRLVDCIFPGRILHPFSLPPTCVAGSLGAVILHSGVGMGASPLRGGSHDAPEGSSRSRGLTKLRVLQSAVPFQEGDGGGWKPIINRLCHSDQVQDEDGHACSWIDSPGRLDVLHLPEQCVLSESDPSEISIVSLLLSWEMCLSVLGIVFQPIHGSASVHQSLCSGFRVWSIKGAWVSFVTWATGRWLWSQGIFFFTIGTFFSSCALIRGLWSTGRSRTSNCLLVFSI